MTTKPRSSARPPFISIAGLMGAGKTTLCNLLHDHLQIGRAIQTADRTYINDVLSNPARWAFESQIAFFCTKALSAIRALETGEPVILDRSLEEDSLIFARLFSSRGHLDDRALALYDEVTRHFLQVLGPPDFLVFLEVSPATALHRITKRGRGEEQLYPSGHLDQLAVQYNQFVSNYTGAPVYRVNTEVDDLTDQKVAVEIVKEISLLRPELGKSNSSVEASPEARVIGNLRCLRRLS
jgi:deoxyadenosine/deoxycytidine kinase